MSKYSVLLTVEQLDSMFIQNVHKQVVFTTAVGRFVEAETAPDRRRTAVMAWAAAQAVRDKVQLTPELFGADVVEALRLIHSPVYTELVARFSEPMN